MSIKDNIKKIRERFDLTQDELGEIAGVSGGAVSTWERGIAEPRMGAVQRISDELNISKADIVDDAIETKTVNVDEEIQALIAYLTGDNSVYCYGEIMSEEGKLALLNSLKQDKEFLTALYKKENK